MHEPDKGFISFVGIHRQIRKTPNLLNQSQGTGSPIINREVLELAWVPTIIKQTACSVDKGLFWVVVVMMSLLVKF